MTTKYGLFAEPPYLKPGAGASSKESSSRKAEEGAKSGFRAGSGNKSGKVILVKCHFPLVIYWIGQEGNDTHPHHSATHPT